MPREKIPDMYTKAQKFTIYVFLDMVTKEFIITKSSNGNSKKLYSRNICGEITKTHDMVENMKKSGRRPCMIKLADIEETPVTAYRYEIAWTALLCDRGYISIAKGEMPYCLDDMLEETIDIYESIKNEDISKLISCNNCMCVTYRQKQCNMIDGTDVKEDEELLDEPLAKGKKVSKMINLSVTPTEKETISRNAEASGKNISQFIRDLCLNPKVVVYRYNEFAKANSKIDNLLKEIDSMCQKIDCLESYSYSDLEFLLRRVYDIRNVEANLAQSFQSSIESRTQELLQSIREQCKSNIVAKVIQSSSPLRKSKNESEKAYIRVRMTNEEYETMLKYKNNIEGKIPNFFRTPNAYMKELAKNYCIVFEDYSEVDRNSTLFRCLNHYVRTIVSLFGDKYSYRPSEIYMICEYYEKTRHSQSDIVTMHYNDKILKDKAVMREIKAQLGKVR